MGTDLCVKSHFPHHTSLNIPQFPKTWAGIQTQRKIRPILRKKNNLVQKDEIIVNKKNLMLDLKHNQTSIPKMEKILNFTELQ